MPIHVGEAAKAYEFSKKLFEAGVFAPATTAVDGSTQARLLALTGR